MASSSRHAAHLSGYFQRKREGQLEQSARASTANADTPKNINNPHLPPIHSHTSPQIATRSVQRESHAHDPHEVIARVIRLVLPHLDPLTLMTCSAVCRDWKLATESPTIWPAAAKPATGRQRSDRSPRLSTRGTQPTVVVRGGDAGRRSSGGANRHSPGYPRSPRTVHSTKGTKGPALRSPRVLDAAKGASPRGSRGAAPTAAAEGNPKRQWMTKTLAQRRALVLGKRGKIPQADPYTGMLPKVPKLLGSVLQCRWSLVVALPDGAPGPIRIKPDHVDYAASSLTLHWHSFLADAAAPPLDRCELGLSTSALVFCGKHKPAAARRPPRSTSLMMAVEPLPPCEAPHPCSTELVRLEQRGPWLVGRWRDEANQGSGGPAFLWLTLHYDNILQRALLGSPRAPYSVPPIAPYVDDVDPLFGLHGYRLCVEWRCSDGVVYGQQYKELGCLDEFGRNVVIAATACATPSAEQVCRHPNSGGAAALGTDQARFAVFTVIGEKTSHQRLMGSPDVKWLAGVIDGALRGVYVDATLVDERGAVLWAESTLCALEPAVNRVGATAVNYRYDADDASIVTVGSSADGAVLETLLLHEGDGGGTVVSSRLWLSLATINRRFGTIYA